MTRNAKKRAATSPKAATSNANEKKPITCACSRQGITRGDLWEAVAFLWLTSVSPQLLWPATARESVWMAREIMEHMDRARGKGAR